MRQLEVGTSSWTANEAGQTFKGTILFHYFSVPDLELDSFLLSFAKLCAVPPHWPGIFAFHAKVYAGAASRASFVALLPS